MFSKPKIEKKKYVIKTFNENLPSFLNILYILTPHRRKSIGAINTISSASLIFKYQKVME